MEIEPSFFEDIRQMLRQARQKAYAAVNSAMVEAYWNIGRRIVEEEQKGEARAGYGEGLIKELSKQLTAEFGKGFAVASLWNYRRFYLTFPDQQILSTLWRELTWSHCRLVMRVDNPLAREYYLREAAEQNWSVRQLERNIHTFYYERLLTSQDKRAALEHQATLEKQTPRDFVKDPYVFEFLDIPEPYQASEKEIEAALIENLQAFLLELGKGFSFVGRQFRISTETSHFYIDLVFYNYILKCFALFDLKTGALTPQDVGQMDMYVRMFDDLKRGADDNPTIGVILCTEKSNTVVKYSVLSGSEQLFATKYRLYLPTEEELIAEIEREKQVIREQLRLQGEQEGAEEA
ncbi:MAG: PDDEXK nuclease domain-containing protein [Acidobacteriota bacterium]|nr:PDDEXK nuclease domain-containing protein [Acidobacteriota bacterium]